MVNMVNIIPAKYQHVSMVTLAFCSTRRAASMAVHSHCLEEDVTQLLSQLHLSYCT